MNSQEAFDAIQAAIVPPFRLIPVGGNYYPEWMIPTNGEIDENDADKYTVIQVSTEDTEECLLYVQDMRNARYDKFCEIDEFLAYINAYKVWSTGDDSQTAPHFDDYCEELYSD